MITSTMNVLFFLVAFYHFLAGLFVLGPKSWVQIFGKNVYALNVPDKYEPRYEITIKFLGLMALAVSALTLEVLIWPNRNIQTFTLFTLSFLFLSRAIMRIVLRQEFFDAYQLSFKRSLANIIFNSFLSLLFFSLAVINV